MHAKPESSRGFGDEPDGFDRPWTPHRMVYINNGSRRGQEACPFCEAPRKTDEEALIIYRDQTCFMIMSLFPYNAGHILVLLYRHIPDYTGLTFEERIEFGEITAYAMRVIRETKNPRGFNLGVNQGAVAGAGIADHLHQYVVSRWREDTNFLPVIAKTKAVPELLGQTRELLVQGFSGYQAESRWLGWRLMKRN